MQSLMKMIARYTGGSDAEVSLSSDKQRNVLEAAGNPGYMETRRRGEGWTVQTSTKLAPLLIQPTTTAALEIYNNGSRLLVVSDLHGYKEIGSAGSDGITIWAMVTTAKAIPTLGALVLNSMSGKALMTPTVTSEVVTAVGQTVVANGWKPYGGGSSGTTTAISAMGFSATIDGKLIVPPGCSLCVHLTCSDVAATSCHVGVTFDIVTATVEA